MPKEELEITIDRRVFRIRNRPLSSAELRQIPTPPVNPDFDLFQEVSGPAADVLVGPDQVVDFESGTSFFTAPRSITAGALA